MSTICHRVCQLSVKYNLCCRSVREDQAAGPQGEENRQEEENIREAKIGAHLTLFLSFKVTASRPYDEAVALNLILFCFASENG
jgi:hypothetical protein